MKIGSPGCNWWLEQTTEQRGLFKRTFARRTLPEAVRPMTARYEPVTFRTQPGLGVHVAASGWSRKFLLSPSRNPDAPRLWCVRVDICTNTGDPDPELPALISGCMFSHTEMVEAFKSIRAETAAWVEAEEQAQLRAWLIANDVKAPLPSGNGDQSPLAPAFDSEEQHAQA